MNEDFHIMVIEDSRVKILPLGSELADFYPPGTVIWVTYDEEFWEEVVVSPGDIWKGVDDAFHLNECLVC